MQKNKQTENVIPRLIREVKNRGTIREKVKVKKEKDGGHGAIKKNGKKKKKKVTISYIQEKELKSEKKRNMRQVE